MHLPAWSIIGLRLESVDCSASHKSRKPFENDIDLASMELMLPRRALRRAGLLLYLVSDDDVDVVSSELCRTGFVFPAFFFCLLSFLRFLFSLASESSLLEEDVELSCRLRSFIIPIAYGRLSLLASAGSSSRCWYLMARSASVPP